MQKRKEYLLNKAFEVFMSKGYDSVSMTILQQEFKMSRGAMYRYFSSKEELFKAVIDKFFWNFLGRFRLETGKDITVSQMIELTYQQLKTLSSFIDRIEGIETRFLNFTALIIQAIKHYPGFSERLKEYKSERLKGWEEALKNSLEMGEIRSDINIKLMAHIFSKSFEIENTETSEKKFSISIELGKKIMDYIYSLIKI